MRGIYKSAWVLVFWVSAFAAQEVALRLAMPSVNPANHIRFIRDQGDLPILGPADRTYRQIKNTGDFDVTVHFNHFGLREQKDVAQAGPRDFFLVGDSFAFGWGVEESDRVSSQLSDLTERKFYNVSVTGNFDTYEKLLDYAAVKGAKVRKVVIMVTMENDLLDYDGARSQSPVPQPVMPAFIKMNFLSFKEGMMNNSALYFLLTSAVHNFDWARNLAEKTGLVAPNLKDKNRSVADAGQLRSSADRLAALAGRFQATIAIIPSRSLWYGTQKEMLNKVHKDFIGLLLERGLDVVDLRPAFEETGAPLSLHFRNDPHWTAKGHALAARTIARHLGLITAPAAQLKK